MLNGALWNLLERFAIQIIQFVFGVYLARILSPTEYGVMGLLLVFIAFMQVFIDAGFGKALIQKQNRNNKDFSTVFVFNILVSILSYIVLWFLAPSISEYYDNENLIVFLRVLSISLFFGALFSIHLTIISIKLKFKLLAKINLFSILVSGIVAIWMAYNGFGVWSLIAQTLLKTFIMVVLSWYYVKWEISLYFSKQSFRNLFSFGSKLLISSILNMSVNNFANVFIAKFNNIKDLGFYTRGTQFGDLLFNIFNSVINNVLLPSLSTIQDDKEKLRRLFKLTLRSTALITIPTFLGLVVLAKPLILFLLGEKWLMTVPILQIICISRLVTISSGINVTVLYVLGRTDLALKQQYIKIIIRVFLVLIALKYGIIYIALAELISTAIHFFINSYYPSKILNYGSFNQIKDISTIIISGILTCVFMYLTSYIFETNLYKLIFASVGGCFVYFILIYLFKIEEMFMLLKKMKLILIKK